MGNIIIVGLGKSVGQLTADALNALKSAPVLFKTNRYPAYAWAVDQGLAAQSLDELYESSQDFDELNENIVARLLIESKTGTIVYAVQDVRDASVELLKQKAHSVHILPGVPVEADLEVEAESFYTAVAAADLHNVPIDSHCALIIRELDNQLLASDIKIILMERYPADHICLISMSYNAAVQQVALEDLDRLEGYDHLCCVLIPAVRKLDALERFDLDDLMSVMRKLRSPEGCPWDREQSHESLKRYLIEEAYEVAEAVDEQDEAALCDELGDVLLQVAFHAAIAEEHFEFDILDITTSICKKMIHRHKHVFGDAQASTPEEVEQIWEQVKQEERGSKGFATSMRQITKSLPALMRAEKVQKKAKAVGFDWDTPVQALEKVKEECTEVQQSLAVRGNFAEELGDLLFAVVNVARLAHVDAEQALGSAVEKFISRFAQMEKMAADQNMDLQNMSLEQMDLYWDRVKKCENP